MIKKRGGPKNEGAPRSVREAGIFQAAAKFEGRQRAGVWRQAVEAVPVKEAIGRRKAEAREKRRPDRSRTFPR